MDVAKYRRPRFRRMAARHQFETQSEREGRILRHGLIQPLHLDGSGGRVSRSSGSGSGKAGAISLCLLRAFRRRQPGLRVRGQLRSLAVVRGWSGQPAGGTPAQGDGVPGPRPGRRFFRCGAERQVGEKRRGVLPVDVPRPPVVVEPARHAYGRDGRRAGRLHQTPRPGAENRRVGAQLPPGRRSRDADGSARRAECRPAPAPEIRIGDSPRRFYDLYRDRDRGHRVDDPGERKRVRSALPDSYELGFHETGIPRFFLDLKNGARTSKLLARPRLERAIGVIYRPETERVSHYFRADMREQFDGVFHFDETRAVEPLDGPKRWLEPEPPETFPSGI